MHHEMAFDECCDGVRHLFRRCHMLLMAPVMLMLIV